ncbi:MAG: hypothetical protein JXB42_10090 [Deltaproteobacteria bacterium]|nr:hypothetical protein [Deltaproteobacteria bacterium]
MKLVLISNVYSSRGAACLKALRSVTNCEILVVLPKIRYGNKSFRETVFALLRRYGFCGFVSLCYRVLSVRTMAFVFRFARGFMKIPEDHFNSVLECLSYQSWNYIVPNGVNDEHALAIVKAFAPDVVITAGTNLVLNQRWLELPRMVAINIHPSLLPKYRGPDPIYWQLKNKEEIAGVSVHYLTADIDGGDVIAQEQFTLNPSHKERDIIRITDALGAKLLLEVLESIDKGCVNARPQDASAATYYGYRSVYA